MKDIILLFLRYILNKFNINLYKTNKNDLDIFLKKIFIFDIGINLIRIGKNTDGGYLIPNILEQIDYCFSPGVGHTQDFEKDLMQRNIKCFLADKTVDNPSNDKFDFNYIKKNINTFNNNENITLQKWIETELNNIQNNNLLLQMDIEGDEIGVLINTPENILNRFKILIIEFHDFDYLGSNLGLKIYNQTFQKILNKFIICHIHPNNCCGYSFIHQYKIPRTMEFTFIRKDLIKNKTEIKYELPHVLDFKNVKIKNDIILPNFFYKY